ncbi:hypothetical protein KO527_05235 [Pseudoalteromonas sp. C2R02]|uniref:hypothetical protein n=1 Tax=Pseudoalteromonas sp. C2R02 TaxID=2841565 RepID=UPI001C088D4C|nr:hypothetical protein [Pseudoalteromonas sp. C2R02]MBU2968751.1 hypothetical protein [Pseudoalteromonas sp. C2R02]
MDELNIYQVVGWANSIALSLVFICNRKDAHRAWLVIALLTAKALNVILYNYIPRNVITPQVFYSLYDLFVILALVHRRELCLLLSKPLLLKTIVGRFAKGVLKSNKVTKQELVIRFLFTASIVVNVLMIGEHLLRHPYFIGLPESMALNVRFIYDHYSQVKLVIMSAITLGLFTMTIDGWVIRQLEKRKALGA